MIVCPLFAFLFGQRRLLSFRPIYSRPTLVRANSTDFPAEGQRSVDFQIEECFVGTGTLFLYMHSIDCGIQLLDVALTSTIPTRCACVIPVHVLWTVGVNFLFEILREGTKLSRYVCSRAEEK